MKLIRTDHQLNPDPYWIYPISKYDYPPSTCVDLFDTNGYDLTELEQDYAEVNTPTKAWRYKRTLKYDWFVKEPIVEGVHINHTALFERKSYSGLALEQLQWWSKEMPIVQKLVRIKSKWGIDFALDYADRDGVVFEVFHYEWDDFNYDRVVEMQHKVEALALKTDWEDVARRLWQRKDEWINLSFFEQSDWKCSFFGIEPERFKNIIWND